MTELWAVFTHVMSKLCLVRFAIISLHKAVVTSCMQRIVFYGSFHFSYVSLNCSFSVCLEGKTMADWQL